MSAFDAGRVLQEERLRRRQLSSEPAAGSSSREMQQSRTQPTRLPARQSSSARRACRREVLSNSGCRRALIAAGRFPVEELDERQGPRAGPLNDTHLLSLLIVNQQRADVRDQRISVGSAATCAKTLCVDSGSIAPVCNVVSVGCRECSVFLQLLGAISNLIQYRRISESG